MINKDFAPTLESERTFTSLDLFFLWVGLVVCIPTFYLAGGLVEMGMSWWQGILTVFVGNLLTLVPMVANGHPGVKYGAPFPVLARASFGIRGAALPSLLRAGVAACWFGLQTHVGGTAIYSMIQAATGASITAAPIEWLGISLPELGCFAAFWAVQVAIITRGMESIRLVEEYGAPILILLSVALLTWAWTSAGGLGPMLSTPSQFGPGGAKAGQFLGTFVAALTANVGFWATLSLNIPDFTRFAKSQRDQVVGQAFGLPLFMAAFTFVGLAVTSATIVMYGHPISDPVVLLSMQQGTIPRLLSLVGLLLATLTTNIAANVVAPANALVNLAPNRISFAGASIAAAAFGAAIMPWRLVASTHSFINWLIGYSVVLGPVGGILVADYWLLRQRRLDIDALYSTDPSGPYWYANGWNPAAITALVVGAAPSIPGLLAEVAAIPRVPDLWANLYAVNWFVGFGLAAVVYWGIMAPSLGGQEADAAAMQPT